MPGTLARSGGQTPSGADNANTIDNTVTDGLTKLDAMFVRYRQAYAGGTAYAVNDMVVDGGVAYVCIQAGTGHTPSSSPTFWDPLDVDTVAYVPGGTDVAVADGGTGASTAPNARTNLGLVIGTDIEAHDADLTAIAALTSAADKLLYATGAQAWALTTLTAFVRTLLDDPDAATVLGTLGVSSFIQGLLDDANAASAQATLALVPGTNVQPHDTQLDTLAALSPAADQFIAWTGAATAEMRDILPGLVERLIINGHSYSYLTGEIGGPLTTSTSALAYGGTMGMGASEPTRQWSALVAKALGVSTKLVQIVVPSAAATTQRSSAWICERECFVHSVVAVAGANPSSITGANSPASRRWALFKFKSLAQVIAEKRFVSGVDASAFDVIPMASIEPIMGRHYKDGVGNDVHVGSARCNRGELLLCTSDPITSGTGLASPEVTFLLRIMDDYWNCAIAAAALSTDGPYIGGWATAMQVAPAPKFPGIPVAISADEAAGQTVLSIDDPREVIPSGYTIVWDTGEATTTTGASTVNSITVTAAIGNPLPKGSLGYAVKANGGGLHGRGGSASVVICGWGVGDIASAADREAWRQAIYAMTIFHQSQHRHIFDDGVGVRNHWIYAAGNGAAAAWAPVTPAAPSVVGYAAYQQFTGAVGATKPTATRRTDFTWDGGDWAICFLAKVGTNFGAVAKIKVDGVDVATIDTNNIDTTGPGTREPMVKVFPVASGAHTIVVEIQSIQASGQLNILWEGPVHNDPKPLVLWHNVARWPLGNDSTVATYNADMTAVISGSGWSAVGSNTVEPAPTNAYIVDIDTALGKLNKNFCGDAVHPSDLGHALMAAATLKVISQKLTRTLALAR